MSLLLLEQRAAIGGTGTFELTGTFSTLRCGILRSVFNGHSFLFSSRAVHKPRDNEACGHTESLHSCYIAALLVFIEQLYAAKGGLKLGAVPWRKALLERGYYFPKS